MSEIRRRISSTDIALVPSCCDGVQWPRVAGSSHAMTEARMTLELALSTQSSTFWDTVGITSSKFTTSKFGLRMGRPGATSTKVLIWTPTYIGFQCWSP
jgi:hypothetical protein